MNSENLEVTSDPQSTVSRSLQVPPVLPFHFTFMQYFINILL
jgi:hypothetical protein